MEEAQNYERRLQLREVNPYLICVLCGGYFVDAASIVECLHTFCWTCIVKYLEKNKFCPICDVQAYKNKPHLSIRPDYTIQRLTYKMVPGLFASEMQRRKEFYLSSEPPTTAIHLSPSSFFSPDESISLSLEYYEAGNNNNDAACHLIGKDHSSMKMKLVPHKRYLQCPAAVTINHLKKFVRMKYGLAAEQLVDIIYQEECLPENFSLMDVAYTFMWDRTTPMRFSYRILERAAVPADSKSDINGAHGYSAPRSQFKKSNWSQNDTTSSSGNGTTNEASGRQLRGNVFRKRKSDSGNESNDASTKDEESDELDNLSLLKRLRVRARQQRLTEKGTSSPRRGSRSSSRKLRKRRKTVAESETPSDYSTATSPDYPGSSIPTNNDDDDSLDDDYRKYEDDIEEITDDFDDEDDEGRLWISPIEDEATEKDSEGTSQEGSVNNDGEEEEKKTNDGLEESSGRYSLKLKKKNKKGKHHHHHHHHKHHDRHVKKAPPATILKSSDTDIMKLKVKLNPIVSCEKYHKSSGKPKLISEVVPLANSNVSTTADTYANASKNVNSDPSSISRNENSNNDRLMNTDKNNPNISSSNEISSSTSRTSRNDEASCGSFNDDDSQNSNGSEENADLNHAKSVINDDPGCQVEGEQEVQKMKLKEKKKEQCFRPLEVPRCKPNFLDTSSKSNPPPLIFTNSDSNSSRSKSPLLHPPSSITVSKITAAEKRKLDENKLLNNNLDSKTADSLRPSLEIMLINGPKMQSFFRDELKKGSPKTKSSDGPNSNIRTSSASTSVSVPASSSSSSCALSSSPLVRLQKMSINLPSVTVTHSTSTQKPYTTKTVVQNGNEPRIQAGSIEISLQKENTAPKRSEDRERKKVEGVKKGAVGEAGVLDLSSTGKLLKPTVSGSAAVRSHQPDQSHQSSQSPKRPKSVTSGFVKQQANKVSSQLIKPKSGSENDSKVLPVSMQNLTILSNAAAHIESRFSMQNAKTSNGSVNTSLATSVNVRSSPVPSTQKKNHSVGNVSSSSQQNMPLKVPSLQQRPITNSGTKQDIVIPRSMPKLNEIDRKQFIRSIPHSNTANGLTTTKPGQNQFVRHITDPSTMIYARQQNAAVVAPITSSSVSSFVKKYGVNNGRLSSPPAAIPIASMLRQGVISRDIEKVTAGLQMKATATAEVASVK